MKRFANLLVVLLSIVSLAIGVVAIAVELKPNEKVEGPQTGVPPLLFSSEGEFTILHLTDFHEWMGIELSLGVKEQDTLKPLLESFIRQSVQLHNPDLVVLGGDNIFSLSSVYDALGNVSLKTYRTIAELFEELNVYWTLTFGNHDSESAKNKYDFLEVVSKYSHFVGGKESGPLHETLIVEAENGESDYVSNFLIPIYVSNGNDFVPAYNVFIMDSGSYDYVNKNDGYRAITSKQTEWYAKKVNLNANIPSIMFSHIPFRECNGAFLNGDGIGVWSGVSPSYLENHILKKIMELKNTKATFFGHNHMNSWTGYYESDGYKLMMGVTPSAQAKSYDDTTSTLSGRIVKLNSNGQLKTFVYNNYFMNESENPFLIYN